MNLIICPTCSGSGYDGRRVCHECRGASRGMLFGAIFLYWGLPLSDFDIRLRRLKEFIDDMINAFALATGIGTFLLLLYFLYKNGFSEFLSLKFWSSALPVVKFFWWGALADLFIIYRLRTEVAWKSGVLKRKYGETLVPNEEGSWDAVKKIKHRKRIDVSKSLTSDALRSLTNAYLLARKWKHGEMNLLHLFAALLQSREAHQVFARIDPEKFKNIVELTRHALTREAQGSKNISISHDIYEALMQSYVDSYSARENLVSTLPLLLYAGMQSKAARELLYDLGIDESKYQNTIQWVRNSLHLRRKLIAFRRAARLRPRGAMDRAMTALATPVLDRWSQDLTRFAASGFLPPVVGREEQFETLFRVIEGGHGAILVGFGGVGKDAIVEGLAARMVEEDVPRLLRDKRLIVLNIADLISGTNAGEAAERLQAVCADIRRSRNIVLYAPHIERLVGVHAGAGGGEKLDLASVFANEVSRGYFTCIASTDTESYRGVIEKNSLRDVFEKIEIVEPKNDLAIQIVEAATIFIEGGAKVFFSYDAISQAVTLSDRYLHDRYLPDKALEILKEAAGLVKKTRGANAFVTGEDVAKIISEKTKIPIASVTQEESDKLTTLEQRLHERIIGQDEAVQAVSRALRRARAELRDAKRPIANFLFLGPTGVGKTETAKAVAAIYFGNEKNMVRLDMSEYQDEASVHRMIGVPGEHSGGLLTEAIRENPFTLLLLDEIEKSHPDILNLFLQVMEDGRLTDNTGKTIDFTNVILIATSNAGTPFIQSEVEKNTPLATIRDRLVRDELKKDFRPEFLNRFDGVIVFRPLTKDEIEQIAHLMLGAITKQLESKGIAFEATDAAVRELAGIGYDPIFGARPLRRAIQERVEDAIAKLLLEQKLGRRDKIIYDVGGVVKIEKAREL